MLLILKCVYVDQKIWSKIYNFRKKKRFYTFYLMVTPLPFVTFISKYKEIYVYFLLKYSKSIFYRYTRTIKREKWSGLKFQFVIYAYVNVSGIIKLDEKIKKLFTFCSKLLSYILWPMDSVIFHSILSNSLFLTQFWNRLPWIDSLEH